LHVGTRDLFENRYFNVHEELLPWWPQTELNFVPQLRSPGIHWVSKSLIVCVSLTLKSIQRNLSKSDTQRLEWSSINDAYFIPPDMWMPLLTRFRRPILRRSVSFEPVLYISVFHTQNGSATFFLLNLQSASLGGSLCSEDLSLNRSDSNVWSRPSYRCVGTTSRLSYGTNIRLMVLIDVRQFCSADNHAPMYHKN